MPRLNVDRGILTLPDTVSYEAGSFVEPLACVVRGQRVARLQPGETVLVLGSGISGLLHVLLARTLGASRIIATDIDDYRLGLARELGADATLKASEDVPARVRELNQGRPADLVMVCTGARSAFDQALASVDRGGTVMCFAPTDPGVTLPVPVNDFWRNSVTLMPSYGASPQDLAVSLDLIAAGRVPVEKMITHRLPLGRSGPWIPTRRGRAGIDEGHPRATALGSRSGPLYSRSVAAIPGSGVGFGAGTLGLAWATGDRQPPPLTKPLQVQRNQPSSA